MPMHFRININGKARDAHVEDNRRMAAALEALRAAITSAWPHGRDYQTCGGADEQRALREQDVKTFTNALHHLEAVERELIDQHAARIVEHDGPAG